MATGESEFGGGGGMVQPLQVGHETDQQKVWEVYATNTGPATDGSNELENAPERVGMTPPLESYTIGG
jgi:hypothetical protein